MEDRAHSDVSLKDLIDASERKMMLSLNCHAIGKIDSFDVSDQTCVATLVYDKKYNTRNEDGTYSDELVKYPAIVDCPVIVLSGGVAGITMPIKKDDNCLILFNDRDIDNWFEGATSGGVATNRKHSFSDAIILVGLNSTTSSIEDYSADNLELFNEDSRINISTSNIELLAAKIKIANTTESLMDIMGDLITEINAISTTNCVVGSPVLIGPPSQINLNLIKTRLGELLE